MPQKRQLISVALILAGAYLLSWGILIPVWESKAAIGQMKTSLRSPLPEELGRQLQKKFNLPVLPFVSLLDRENWSEAEFFLTIKKLGLERVPIIANLDGGDASVYLKELQRGVGHLRGSARPGERGNVFLFGHSSLPLPFRRNDYATVFSNLGKLKVGDTITVEFGGRRFLYRVSQLRVVPAESQIEELKDDREKLILLTCFPPGLLTERLVVTALPNY